MIRKLSIAKAKAIGDAASFYSLTFRASLSTAAANDSVIAGTKSNSERIFAPYTVFKGKAALSVSPVLPSFVKTDYGGLKLDRRGVMMMTFWPAVGVRKYDWEKRLLFALSATEIGSLISLGSSDPCEFFHDPSMQTSNAGQVRKSLSFKPHVDGSGYFISLNVNNSIQKTNESLTVPVTKAEFAVMRTAFSFALPRLMGWDHYADPVPGSATKNLSNSSRGGPQLLDLEWDK